MVVHPHNASNAIEKLYSYRPRTLERWRFPNESQISGVSAGKELLRNKHPPCQILLVIAGETSKNNGNPTWASQQALCWRGTCCWWLPRGPRELGANLPHPGSSPIATSRLCTGNNSLSPSDQPGPFLHCPRSLPSARGVGRRQPPQLPESQPRATAHGQLSGACGWKAPGLQRVSNICFVKEVVSTHFLPS